MRKNVKKLMVTYLHTAMESYEAGLDLIARIEKRRQQHGYSADGREAAGVSR